MMEFNFFLKCAILCALAVASRVPVWADKPSITGEGAIFSEYLGDEERTFDKLSQIQPKTKEYLARILVGRGLKLEKDLSKPVGWKLSFHLPERRSTASLWIAECRSVYQAWKREAEGRTLKEKSLALTYEEKIHLKLTAWALIAEGFDSSFRESYERFYGEIVVGNL